MCVAVAETATSYQSYPQPTHATKPATRHVEGTLDRLRLAKEPRAGDFSGQLQTHGTENGTPCTEPRNCTILFADRNRRLENMLPNALHKQLRTERAAESPGDQSGPNKHSGLIQCDLQQNADSDSSSSPRRRCVCSPQLSTTEESSVAAASTHTQSRLITYCGYCVIPWHGG